MSNTIVLPSLVLPHPFLLVPTARVTFPVSKPVGEALLTLAQESQTQPVIAAFPLKSPDPHSVHEWGTAAHIVRLVRPPSRTSRQGFVVSLQGLSRVHLPSTPSSLRLDDLTECNVTYPPPEGIPSDSSVALFRAAALRLLDQLARDATQLTRRDTYTKIAGMVDEVSDQRAAWLADVMVAAINADHQDKLGASISLHLLSLIRFGTNVFLGSGNIWEWGCRVYSTCLIHDPCKCLLTGTESRAKRVG